MYAEIFGAVVIIESALFSLFLVAIAYAFYRASRPHVSDGPTT